MKSGDPDVYKEKPLGTLVYFSVRAPGAERTVFHVSPPEGMFSRFGAMDACMPST